jgi:uncharacterized protein involved in exopolysaccharide biosynthesis
MPAPQQSAFDELRTAFQAYALLLRRRWRLALLGFSAAGALALGLSQRLPHKYVATTIFERRDDVVLRNLIQTNSPYGFEHLKSSIVLDMTGSRALADAAGRVGILAGAALSSDGPLPDETAQRLDGALGRRRLRANVRLITSSAALDTIELRVEANDPDVARRFVIALRDRYIDETRKRIADVLNTTSAFFEAELDKFQQHASQANERLASLFAEFPGVDPRDVASVGHRLEGAREQQARLRERRAEVAAQIAAREQFLMEAELERREGAAGSNAETADADVAAAGVARAIEQVEREIREARAVRRMTAEHPAVRALERKLRELHAVRESILAVSAERGAQGAGGPPEKNAYERRVEMELDAFRKEIVALDARLTESDQATTRLASLYAQMLDDSSELRRLDDRIRQDDATASIWRQHQAQLERILAAESEQRGTRFTLIEEPRFSARAVSPTLASVFGAGGGLSAAAAVLLIALAELLDRSLRSAPQAAQALGIPVLAEIGVVWTPAARRRRRRSRLLWAPALTACVLSLAMTTLIAYASLERPEWSAAIKARLSSLAGWSAAASNPTAGGD